MGRPDEPGRNVDGGAMTARVLRAVRRRLSFWREAVRAATGGFRIGEGELCAALGLEAGAEVCGAMEGPAEKRFLFEVRSREALARRFAAEYPEVAEAVVAWADRVCKHEFDLLGSGPVKVGERIPWRQDFVAGRTWWRVFSPLLPVQFGGDASDIKRVWELSRCQHFAVLGEAYALTGDEGYALEWVAEMTDWDRENPPMVGPNWMVAMEAAIRIVNWIWGYFFMADSPAFTQGAARVFYKALLSHGRFIVRHLEPYGNHRFSDFVGLVFLGVLFPQFKEAEQWREMGLKGFCEELVGQVRSDGCHFEGSIPYHRLVLEMAATTWLLLRRNGIALPSEAQEAVERMFRFTAACVKPSGHAPQIGDADDGRLQELTPLDKRDHSYLLSLAAVLTGNGEFKISENPHPETFWLLAADGPAGYDALPTTPPKMGSAAFTESGFYVLRSDRVHAFVSCRRPDRADVGAHVHNDHLSFTLSLDGADFIVDAGTYTYTGDPAARNEFRSTEAHNTLMVDGREINPLNRSDPFRLKDRADCRVVAWRTSDAEDVLAAEHDGYARLGVRVRRQFLLDRKTSTLTVRDSVSGQGQHRLEWRFLFAPDVRLRLDDKAVMASIDGAALRMRLDGNERLNARVKRVWYSPSYGVRQAAEAVVVETTCALPLEVEFVFQPGLVGEERHASAAQQAAAP